MVCTYCPCKSSEAYCFWVWQVKGQGHYGWNNRNLVSSITLEILKIWTWNLVCELSLVVFRSRLLYDWTGQRSRSLWIKQYKSCQHNNLRNTKDVNWKFGLWVALGSLQKLITFGLDRSKVRVIMDRTIEKLLAKFAFKVRTQNLICGSFL